jgi:hypothetical protein
MSFNDQGCRSMGVVGNDDEQVLPPNKALGRSQRRSLLFRTDHSIEDHDACHAHPKLGLGASPCRRTT